MGGRQYVDVVDFCGWSAFEMKLNMLSMHYNNAVYECFCAVFFDLDVPLGCGTVVDN